eukprot:scaffold97112_cov41-Prasinocladus_malaysianus.AAC.2
MARLPEFCSSASSIGHTQCNTQPSSSTMACRLPKKSQLVFCHMDNFQAMPAGMIIHNIELKALTPRSRQSRQVDTSYMLSFQLISTHYA